MAFGLPILSGILKLKEKAESKGLDVYDIPYKKGAAKKKEELVTPKKEKKKKEVKAKESSEDGYSSGDEDDDSSEERVKRPGIKKKFKKAEDYLEEIEVPIRKKNTSVEDENDSDDENYVHLSDMLDSDDLADNSDEENGEGQSDDEENDEGQSDDENVDEGNSDDGISIDDDNESGVEESDGLDEEASDEEVEDLGNPDETGKLMLFDIQQRSML